MAGSDVKVASEDVFDLDRIRQLIELMKQHDLSEIDLRHDKQQIRLARGSSGGSYVSLPPAPPATASPPLATAGSSATEALTIKSPMVGTFYARSNPNAEVFVKTGDVVGPETVVCIVEAMKVFNEIVAEVSGKIVAVLVKDQDPVEFGTPLFRVEPHA